MARSSTPVAPPATRLLKIEFCTAASLAMVSVATSSSLVLASLTKVRPSMVTCPDGALIVQSPVMIASSPRVSVPAIPKFGPTIEIALSIVRSLAIAAGREHDGVAVHGRRIGVRDRREAVAADQQETSGRQSGRVRALHHFDGGQRFGPLGAAIDGPPAAGGVVGDVGRAQRRGIMCGVDAGAAVENIDAVTAGQMVVAEVAFQNVRNRAAADDVIGPAADDILDIGDQKIRVIGVLQHRERQIDLDAAAAAADEAEIDRIGAGAAGVSHRAGARADKEIIVAAAAIECDAVRAGQPAGIDNVDRVIAAAIDGDGRGGKAGAAEIAGDDDRVGAGAGVDIDVLDALGRDFEIAVVRRLRTSRCPRILMPTNLLGPGPPRSGSMKIGLIL